MKQWFHAVVTQDINYVKQNIKKFANVTDKIGRTSLMLSALMGNTELITELKPYELKTQTNTGMTALMMACYANNETVVQLLLEEAKIVAPNGMTALMVAASADSLIPAQLLLQHEKRMQTTEGLTALIFAIQQQNIDIINLLLKYEYDICDCENKSVIFHAVESLDFQVFKIVLENCKQLITNVDYKGQNILFLMVELINKNKEDQSASQLNKMLKFIFQSFQETQIQQLLEHRDNEGETFLMHCCQFYYNDVFEQKFKFSDLLKKQLQSKNKTGQTALMRAANAGNLLACKFLIKDEIMMQDDEGKTALFYTLCSTCQNHEILQLLFQKEYQMKDFQNNNLLHYAAKNSQNSKIIFQYKSVFNSLNSLNQSPLQNAIMNLNENDFQAFQIIENLKGFFNIIDSTGKTNLMYCAIYDKPKFAGLFTPQKNQLDKDKKSASIHAAENDSFRVICQLISIEKVFSDERNVFARACICNSFRVCKLFVDLCRGVDMEGNDFIKQNSASLQQICTKMVDSSFKFGNYPNCFYNGLELAIMHSSVEAMRVLSYYKFPTNAQNRTPLMLAVQKEKIDISIMRQISKHYIGQQLKKSVGNIAAGSTALMIACMQSFDNEKVVQFLAEVEREMKNDEGKSAADFINPEFKHKYMKYL